MAHAHAPNSPLHTPDRRRARAEAQLSRRRFLASIGIGAAGAAGVAVLGTGIGAAEAQTPANRFGRMFPNLPPFMTVDARRRAALVDIGRPGGMMDALDPLAAGPDQLVLDPTLSANNPNNTTHTAGTTFFGQFLDHDMTLDVSSPLGTPTPPEQSPNGRTPALDLDSVYGGGPVADPELYQADRIRLRIESGGLFEDVPRMPNRTAIIADPRNDENAIIGGMQAAFILFHNNVVQMLQDSGFQGNLFQEARRLVTWHYQWIIVNQFLPQVIGQALVNNILTAGRRFYRPTGQAFIPVEFQIGYRMGHSMIRPSYALNLGATSGGTGAPFFGFIFDPAGQGQADPVDLRGGARAPRRFVGWEIFFNFNDGNVRPNKHIDRVLSTPLFRLPLQTLPDGAPPDSLAVRNLLRTVTWSVPAGQLIAQWMGNPVLHLTELSHYGVALENHTPLWYYMLAEAEDLAGGLTLGPTGGRIVGEVFIGLLQLDPSSYLAADPNWRPTLPSTTPGSFLMQDLLRFAEVDPFTRRA
jgi:Animal haem peroxidase